MSWQKDNFIPNWEQSDNWEEFEWEEALKYSDHLASRYFRLLERFDDLPDADEVIASNLGDPGLFQSLDINESDYWMDDETDFDDLCNEADEIESLEFVEQLRQGDTYYFETSPVFLRARQISLGWCNILASVLKPDDRFWGLKVLFYLGRLLSYLSLSIGDGTYDQLNGSIIFAKRALQIINLIIGELDLKSVEHNRYIPIFNMVKKHLLEDHDILVDYLIECKNRKHSNDNKAE